MPIDQETIVTSFPARAKLRLADRQDKIIELGHRRRMAVQNFVFEEDHRIGIADRGLEQALGVSGGGR